MENHLALLAFTWPEVGKSKSGLQY